MRQSLAVFTVAVITLLTACSSVGSQGPTSALPNSAAALAQHVVRVTPDKKKTASVLFVSVLNTVGGAVDILQNISWKKKGTITHGVDVPYGVWVDSSGNLYVADYGGGDITEYAKGGSSPKFSYKSGVDSPFGVTTDHKGNVYEYDGAGYVSEYAQGSNKQIDKCSFGTFTYPTGTAVDSSGDVFVGTETTSTKQVVEYKGGLKGCRATTLGATVEYPGGMVFDKSDDLIVCDQLADAVDIIKPPYKRISGTLGSGYSNPYNVTLDKNNDQAYVTNIGSDTSKSGYILILSYPQGTVQAKLGSSDGFEYPIAAVDSTNYVP